MKTYIIIPMRMGSERYPGKLFKTIAGKPLWKHVYDMACKCNVDEVYIAIDKEDSKHLTQSFINIAYINTGDCRTGTDRVAEAMGELGADENDIVVNVQADCVVFDPEIVHRLIRELKELPHIWPRHKGQTRPVTPIQKANAGESFDTNRPKVVFDAQMNALYFSRESIPFKGPPTGNCWKHVGIYCMTNRMLQMFTALPTGRLEEIERLEQLRFLENGIPIRCVDVDDLDYYPVDVPEDMQPAREVILNA